MTITVRSERASEYECDCLIAGVFEHEPELIPAMVPIDEALHGAVSKLIEVGEISGKLGTWTIIHTEGRIPAHRVIVTGLGSRERFDGDVLRRASAVAMKRAREVHGVTVASVLYASDMVKVEPLRAVQMVVEGALLGLYRFQKYKSGDDSPPDPSELSLVGVPEQELKSMRRAAERGEVLSEAQNMARDLVNEPANHMTPTLLAERAVAVSQEVGLEIDILSRTEMERLGMGALLGVSQGSDEPPKMIVLKTPTDPDLPLMALVGKGVTFDSGGLSLKPPQSMETMKIDMAGGAAVIGAMGAIARLRPRANVMVIVPAAENLPSGHALRPGDILRAMNGKTIEIISTDAEGRLLLADALAYARSKRAGWIIDIATLTGGCVVALGHLTSAVMGNDQQMIDLLIDLSQDTGERMWQLPLFDEYREQLKSDVADIKNSGGRFASTITAGTFLKEFVGDARWVHIDIAGKAMIDKEKEYLLKGPSGVGARTLVELVFRLADTLLVR
jgi:leucyl aminopeptidase